MRHSAGAYELMLCTISVGIWTFGYILEILVPDLPSKLIWAKFEYLGISTVSVWVLLFITRYTRRSTRFNFKYMAALLVVPLLTVIFVITNDAHNWVWTSAA